MKIFITTDLEGPAGVNLWSQTRDGETPEKYAAMHLLTAEVNAAVDGILDASPEAEIIVIDGHGSGGLIYEEMHAGAQVIMKSAYDPTDKNIKPASNASSYDGYMLVGQHAMAGTPMAPLCHTFNSRSIEYYKLNGQYFGEFGCHAVRFGQAGVPTIFHAGDDKACEEALNLVPDIVTVATKRGLGVQRALHLSPATARERIRKGAKEAIQKIDQIKPLRIEGPYELEVRVLEGLNPLDRAFSKNYKVIDKRTVVNYGDSLEDIFGPLSFA